MGQHLSSRRFGYRAGQTAYRVYRIFDIRHKNLDRPGFCCSVHRRCGRCFPHLEQKSEKKRQRIIQSSNPTFTKAEYEPAAMHLPFYSAFAIYIRTV
jgi:hypothetical protein